MCPQIAVEGCGHGELDKIYETMQYLERTEGKKIDLLICCGDFQVGGAYCLTVFTALWRLLACRLPACLPACSGTGISRSSCKQQDATAATAAATTARLRPPLPAGCAQHG
jgi:hypothetical protein